MCHLTFSRLQDHKKTAVVRTQTHIDREEGSEAVQIVSVL